MTTAKRFIPLEPPVRSASFLGWYVASIELADPTSDQYYYLHDDGRICEFCDTSGRGSTGWFASADEAYAKAVAYYHSYGIVYPYVLADDGRFYNLDGTSIVKDDEPLSETIESQVMEF